MMYSQKLLDCWKLEAGQGNTRYWLGQVSNDTGLQMPMEWQELSSE